MENKQEKIKYWERKEIFYHEKAENALSSAKGCRGQIKILEDMIEIEKFYILSKGRNLSKLLSDLGYFVYDGRTTGTKCVAEKNNSPSGHGLLYTGTPIEIWRWLELSGRL